MVREKHVNNKRCTFTTFFYDEIAFIDKVCYLGEWVVATVYEDPMVIFYH